MSDEAPYLTAYKVVGVSLDTKINYVYMERNADHDGQIYFRLKLEALKSQRLSLAAGRASGQARQWPPPGTWPAIDPWPPLAALVKIDEIAELLAEVVAVKREIAESADNELAQAAAAVRAAEAASAAAAAESEAKVAKAKAAKAQAEANATEAAKAKDRAVAQAEAAVKTPIDLCSPSPPPPTSRTNTEVADITEDGLVSSPASDTLAIFCKASPRIRLLYTSQCFFNPRSQTENRSRSMSITGLVSTSSVSDLSSRVSEAERRGVPVTELKEGLLAHVDSRYVKTG